MVDNLSVKRDETGLVTIGEKVWDAEKHDHVIITAEMQEQYVALCNQYVMTEAIRSNIAFRMRALHGYTAGGYTSFKTWCEGFAKISSTMGHRLAERGERMFLLVNAAGNMGLPGEKIQKALTEGNAKTRQYMLSLPTDEALGIIEKAWIDPAGNERMPDEVMKILGHDRDEMLKGTQDELKRKTDALNAAQEQIKTLETERDDMLESVKGGVGIAQKMVAKVKVLEEENELLRGKREHGDVAATTIKRAESLIEQGITLLRPYVPQKDEDFDEYPDEIALAMGAGARMRIMLSAIVDQGQLLERQREEA